MIDFLVSPLTIVAKQNIDWVPPPLVPERPISEARERELSVAWFVAVVRGAL